MDRINISKIIYKLLLTTNSIGLLLIVYLVKEKKWITAFNNYAILLYVLLLLLFTGICLLSKRLLSRDIIEGGIKNIEMANDGYLPSYLGYFFVALSIPKNDMQTLLFVFGVLFVFVFFSRTVYYNPLFLIFGYRFYYITKANDVKVFIISQQEICEVDGLTFKKLRRINNFTYIDEEK
ncbi:MAG: hypothetical protein PHY47_20115 [Lachnospiraceae bacterium]|nr:hypothetical protein [Lachnospiraceae bacterium]